MVAARRRDLGLTQRELAKTARVSVDSIAKIETGATGARFSMIEKIARALKVKPVELFGLRAETAADGRTDLSTILDTLIELTPEQLEWVQDVIDLAFRRLGR